LISATHAFAFYEQTPLLDSLPKLAEEHLGRGKKGDAFCFALIFTFEISLQLSFVHSSFLVATLMGALQGAVQGYLNGPLVLIPLQLNYLF